MICVRLRSTDVIGWGVPERIEILLTDTGLDGAMAVAGWVRSAEARLGLECVHSLHVYPSALDPLVRAGGAEPLPMLEPWPPLQERVSGWKRSWNLLASAFAADPVP